MSCVSLGSSRFNITMGIRTGAIALSRWITGSTGRLSSSTFGNVEPAACRITTSPHLLWNKARHTWHWSLLASLLVFKRLISSLSKSRYKNSKKYFSFSHWQSRENPSGDSNPQHWDHALLLTGLELFAVGRDGISSHQIVGLAPIGGMCTATSSCTVNEGRHFESVYVVAHEIGHKWVNIPFVCFNLLLVFTKPVVLIV